MLKLDCSKARAALGWRPRLSLEKALEKVVDWHKSVADGDDAREVSLRQLREYGDLANVGGGRRDRLSALSRGAGALHPRLEALAQLLQLRRDHREAVRVPLPLAFPILLVIVLRGIPGPFGSIVVTMLPP